MHTVTHIRIAYMIRIMHDAQAPMHIQPSSYIHMYSHTYLYTYMHARTRNHVRTFTFTCKMHSQICTCMKHPVTHSYTKANTHTHTLTE